MPNTLVVNLGETLARISGGQIKATRHRVYDIGRERFSCPFFFSPKYSAIVDTDILQSERQLCEDPEYDKKMVIANGGQKPKSLMYGQVLCRKMTNAYGEWKGF